MVIYMSLFSRFVLFFYENFFEYFVIWRYGAHLHTECFSDNIFAQEPQDLTRSIAHSVPQSVFSSAQLVPMPLASPPPPKKKSLPFRRCLPRFCYRPFWESLSSVVIIMQ